jgi:hypothetical protein
LIIETWRDGAETPKTLGENKGFGCGRNFLVSLDFENGGNSTWKQLRIFKW